VRVKASRVIRAGESRARGGMGRVEGVQALRPLRCSGYPEGYDREAPEHGRCKNEATVWLLRGGDTPVPGAYLCQACAGRVLVDCQKAGLKWRCVPIVDYVEKPQEAEHGGEAPA
jgi:hypothetical protein